MGLPTSRLRGEHVFHVPPLSLPDAEHDFEPEVIAKSHAVQLFVERVRDLNRDFILTSFNAPAVVEICTRLDGLPLALELAAARAEHFTDELRNELGEPFKLLVDAPRDLPDRQQRLHSTIDWSYGLLTAGEQALFRRLGVFVGGFNPEAVQVVCGAERNLLLEVLDGLETLARQSLLRRETPFEGRTRFGMLETIREYAVEQLAANGEELETRQ
jgi:predicted ATPase